MYKVPSGSGWNIHEGPFGFLGAAEPTFSILYSIKDVFKDQFKSSLLHSSKDTSIDCSTADTASNNQQSINQSINQVQYWYQYMIVASGTWAVGLQGQSSGRNEHLFGCSRDYLKVFIKGLTSLHSIRISLHKFYGFLFWRFNTRVLNNSTQYISYIAIYISLRYWFCP